MSKERVFRSYNSQRNIPCKYAHVTLCICWFCSMSGRCSSKPRKWCSACHPCSTPLRQLSRCTPSCRRPAFCTRSTRRATIDLTRRIPSSRFETSISEKDPSARTTANSSDSSTRRRWGRKAAPSCFSCKPMTKLPSGWKPSSGA